jgi:hypothetical protein
VANTIAVRSVGFRLAESPQMVSSQSQSICTGTERKNTARHDENIIALANS